MSRLRASAGYSLVEILVVLTILTLAGAMFARALASVHRLDPMVDETSLASEQARIVIESMRNRPFAQVFALYNDDPADDPGGPGTAPGSGFDVPGLVAPPGSATVGRVQFPSPGPALRESADDEGLGMPRDLDGDGQVDGNDHSGDYIILPVRIRLEWSPGPKATRNRALLVYTMLSGL